jgi:hypothetical protein
MQYRRKPESCGLLCNRSDSPSNKDELLEFTCTDSDSHALHGGGAITRCWRVQSRSIKWGIGNLQVVAGFCVRVDSA